MFVKYISKLLIFFIMVSCEINLFNTLSIIKDHRENEHYNKDITTSLDTSINPCNDFYQYACGGWIKNTIQPEFEPIWNHWQSVTHKIIKLTDSILKSKKPFTDYFWKVQQMYFACLHKKNSLKYVNNLKQLINSLYGWPVVTETWPFSKKYEWEIEVSRVTRILGIYPLIKMHVFIDIQNTSQYILYIDHGDLNLPQAVLLHPKNYKQHLKAYEMWILETIKYLYPRNVNNTLMKEIVDMINFEIELAKLSMHKEKSEKISIKTLLMEVPMKWEKMFKTLFSGTLIKIAADDVVMLRSRLYLQKLIHLISETDTKTMANYIIWSTVKSLSRETTKYTKHLNFLMDKALFGTKNDMSQSHECINTIYTYMDSAVIIQYVHTYVNKSVIDTVITMAKHIQTEFIATLKMSWLNETTKKLSIEKINTLQFIIGHPLSLNNASSLQDFREVKITTNHFVNIIRQKSFKVKTNLEKLGQMVQFEWPGSLFETNAYYSILQNTIFIPVGLLEPPFFYKNGPAVANYGALGSLIGHEISHALDNLGRRADKNGNIRNWWSDEDSIKYDTQSNCFKDQYARYNSCGSDTLGENIADNVGFQLSYDAYQNLKINELQNDNFNGVNEYSNNQLFLISFARVWCEISTDSDFLNDEEHSRVKIRVLGTLENSKMFYKTFYCYQDNSDKCKMW